MTCFYNLSRGSHAFEQEQYLEKDRVRMCQTIRQTPKTCLAFKILAAGRNCATQQNVQEAFQFAFDNIKQQDAVVVGMFPKDTDQVSLNVQYTLEAIQNAQMVQGKDRLRQNWHDVN